MAGDVDRIKAKLDIVDLIRSYLPLHPAGKNFKALCPFHPEKTPSFIVSPDRHLWHCFGCGEGGDGIKFLMRYENLEFSEALRMLAERLGVELSSLDSREQRELGLLYDVHKSAEELFVNELANNIDAKKYLHARGLNDETIKTFGIGFAKGGESLTLHLLKRGYDMNVIVRAGLAHKSTTGLYRDRFGGRIAFPLINSVGKTIGFSGRLLESAVTHEGQPKYLNSPETPIFKKSKFLYGFNKSKADIAREKAVFLVEGQMDLLLAWQVGIKNVVAISGTGLSRDHLERLRRIADTIFVSFDNDTAGLTALERSLEIFSELDFHIRAVDLGTFKDPAEAAQGDPEFLKRTINEAQSAFSYLVAQYFPENEKRRTIQEDRRILRHLLTKIQQVKSAVEQNSIIKEIAKRTGISEVSILSELSTMSPANLKKSDEELRPEQGNAVTGRIDVIARRIIALAFTDDKLSVILQQHKSSLPKQYGAIIDNPTSEEAGMYQLHGSYLREKSKEDSTKEFHELLRQLEIETLRTEQRMLRDEMRKAEQSGDEKALSIAFEKFNVLAQKLNQHTLS